MNFEAMSTSLNLKVDVLINYRNMNNNNDIEIINGSIFFSKQFFQDNYFKT